jgi:predicted metalloprotease with PDZ domain
MSALYSIGLRLSNEGAVMESIVGSLVYKAGITSGMRVVAVNDRACTADLLRDAVRAGKNNSPPLRLLVVNDDYY